VFLVELHQRSLLSAFIIAVAVLDRFQLWLQRLQTRGAASLERVNQYYGHSQPGAERSATTFLGEAAR
jgi:hypothetical protein